MRWPIQKNLINILYTIALIILGAIGVITYIQLEKLATANAWVDHTYQVISTTDTTLANILDAESRQRGYLITGNLQYLDYYNAAAKATAQSSNALFNLTEDNPLQHSRVNDYKTMIQTRINMLASVVATYQQQGPAAAIKILNAGQGEALTIQIKQKSQEILAEEESLLQQRTANAIRYTYFSNILVIIGDILSFCLLLLSFILLKRQISFRIKADKELREIHNLFSSAFDYAATGMALRSLDGFFLKVNPAFCQLLGYTEAELLKMDSKSITHPDDRGNGDDQVNQLLQNKIQNYQSEKRFLHKEGKVIWALLSVSLVRDSDNKPLYLVAQIQNITVQKQAEEQLKHLAYHDTLTGLANRIQLEHDMQRLFAYANRHQEIVAILFLDLDHFKHINDSLGHGIGDELLKSAGERIKSCIRATDIVSRIGGDEFVVVLADTQNKEITIQCAEKIVNVLAQPFKIKGHNLTISTSIGISIYPNDGTESTALIKYADLALYAAKNKGRNNFKFYSKTMHND